MVAHDALFLCSAHFAKAPRQKSENAIFMRAGARFKTPCLPLITRMINRGGRAHALNKNKGPSERDSPALNYHHAREQAFQRERKYTHIHMQLYIGKWQSL